jgi:hypothetical protein
VPASAAKANLAAANVLVQFDRKRLIEVVEGRCRAALEAFFQCGRYQRRFRRPDQLRAG